MYKFDECENCFMCQQKFVQIILSQPTNCTFKLFYLRISRCRMCCETTENNIIAMRVINSRNLMKTIKAALHLNQNNNS